MNARMKLGCALCLVGLLVGAGGVVYHAHAGSGGKDCGGSYTCVFEGDPPPGCGLVACASCGGGYYCYAARNYYPKCKTSQCGGECQDNQTGYCIKIVFHNNSECIPDILLVQYACPLGHACASGICA